MNKLLETLPKLERRRADLGMSEAVLAKKAGLSRGAVRRTLSGNLDVSLHNFTALAQALGVGIRFEMEPVETSLARQAERKARELVGLVQGNMGLESQAVDPNVVDQMVQQTVHQLLAGSKRNLWG